MSEERDGEPADEPRRGHLPGSYYYDDATGYEIYSPDDEDGEGDEPEEECAE